MPVQYRPELHVTAETGVLNAPAGVLRDGHAWHVFYQFQPKIGAPPRWGHVVSENGPFDWTECDDVLAPVGDETAVRAGSVVAHGEGVDLYYTSVTPHGTSVKIARIATLENTCEVSDEPAKLDGIIARNGVAVDNRDGLSNFRSPCVVRGWETNDDRDAGHAGWLMLAVTGPIDDPQPVILTSPNARDWEVSGPLTFDGEHGLDSPTRMVAPRILRLRDEVDGNIYDVLLITLERGGRDITGYLVGALHGATFHVTTRFTRIDYGYDFTRPRTAYQTAATGPIDFDEAVIFGLLNRAGRADDPSSHLSIHESDWANVMSLPRVLRLEGGRIFQAPRAGVLDAIGSSCHARSWIGICNIPADGTVTIDILDEDNVVAFTVTHRGDHVAVDRSMNPFHADDEESAVALDEAESHSLSVFVDGSTVEVFADGGQAALASRAYIPGGLPTFRVSTTGGASVERSYEHSPTSSGSTILADLKEIGAKDGLFADDQ